MELEYSFQQSGFLAALQFVIVASILALDLSWERLFLFQRFVRTATSYVEVSAYGNPSYIFQVSS
jgi:hypothetical protein